MVSEPNETVEQRDDASAGVDEPDPVYARKAVVAASVGYGLDGFDLLILSFALSGIITSFGISETSAGWLTTLTLLGAVLGGFIFGPLSDRYGRVKVLTYSVILFGVFTGLSAIAFGFVDMAIYRFIAGIGIGGEFGIGMTLAAEAVRAKSRARATSYVSLGFQLGVLAASVLSAPIIALWGWRGLFVVGVVPALVAIFLRMLLPEPEKFTKMQEEEKPERFALRYLVADRRTIMISIALVVVASVQNFGYYGIMTWLPRYLDQEIGVGLVGSSVWTGVTVVGMMLGIVMFGQLADRIGRRITFWIFQVGAAVMVLVYSLIDDPTALLVGGFFMGLFANGMMGGLGALMAEMYPTKARATAQNVIWNLGRGVAGFAPVVIAALATHGGFGFALGLLPLIYVLAFVAMFFIPERKGAELE